MELALVFFNKAAVKRWEKLTSTLSEFVVSLSHFSEGVIHK